MNKQPVKDCELDIDDLVEGQEYKFRVCAETAAGPGKPATTDEIVAKDPFGKTSFDLKGNDQNIIPNSYPKCTEILKRNPIYNEKIVFTIF